MSLGNPISRQSAQENAKIVSHKQQPPVSSREYSCYSFLLKPKSSPGPLCGNRTQDPPACSSVPHPTTPQRAPCYNLLLNYLYSRRLVYCSGKSSDLYSWGSHFESQKKENILAFLWVFLVPPGNCLDSASITQRQTTHRPPTLLSSTRCLQMLRASHNNPLHNQFIKPMEHI